MKSLQSHITEGISNDKDELPQIVDESNLRGTTDGPDAKRSDEYLSRVSDILNLMKNSKNKEVKALFEPVWKAIRKADPNINDDLTWSKWKYKK